jgi:hypothetical protein
MYKYIRRYLYTYTYIIIHISGSSKTYPRCVKNDQMRYYLNNNNERNPLMYNWNSVHVRYCDGSSYAGDISHVYENVSLFI